MPKVDSIRTRMSSSASPNLGGDDLRQLLTVRLVDGADHRLQFGLAVHQDGEQFPALGQFGRDP